MAPIRLKTMMANRLLVLGVFAACTGLLFSSPVLGQVSPEEHQKHHPGARPGDTGGPARAAGVVGGMAGMGPMGAMCGLAGMGATPPRELYPSLMNLPELSPEKRAEVQRQAHERMKAGVGLMSRGLDGLSKTAPGNDYAAMQEATAQVREGLAMF